MSNKSWEIETSDWVPVQKSVYGFQGEAGGMTLTFETEGRIQVGFFGMLSAEEDSRCMDWIHETIDCERYKAGA